MALEEITLRMNLPGKFKELLQLKISGSYGWGVVKNELEKMGFKNKWWGEY